MNVINLFLSRKTVRPPRTWQVGLLGLALLASLVRASASDTVWIDDSLPAGVTTAQGDFGDTWNWINSNPTPSSGTLAHQSVIAAGLHQHYFSGATATLSVNAGDQLFAYVYLDPANPPSEVMLQWNDGSWEHRAYWGANNIAYGTSGSASRYNAGTLPATGQWVRLQVPASAVALEGRPLNGMTFSAYGGRVTWDYAGKADSGSSTGTPPVTTTNSTPPVTTTNSTPPVATNTIPSVVTNVPPGNITNAITATANTLDPMMVQTPKVGDNALHILSPNLLELELINSKASGAAVGNWDFVNGLPAASKFAVSVNGQAVTVQSVGFKRRVSYAPLNKYDLRMDNCVYLQLATSIADNQPVAVKNPDGSLWNSAMQFTNTTDPLRYNAAIHVNQEGYVPSFPKKANVGYYLGSLGEMNISASSGFKIVDANSGATVYSGPLTTRPDVGYTYSPTPYQKVLEADFSSFTTPGEYRLMVPGMGASLPFLIDEGVAMAFARTYSLGLYSQRCGTSNTAPYTRFTRGACHTAPASVPSPQSNTAYNFTWATISGYASGVNNNNPPQTAPLLTSEANQLYPFVNKGTVDVSGGHHDAGDYSKYTINSAQLVHVLMFAVDSMPGVSALDNLGLPESGDGISDVMQEAKWEADYIAKLQDADGGFYFIVYPINREYEGSVSPDHGDAQVVWPKNTAVTAASVAALAECASSPKFKAAYPAAAALYMQKAQLGWKFLTNAIAKYGKAGAYQKITFYGDDFTHDDELAWAAAAMFAATGDPAYQQKLISWFDPSSSTTWRWGWQHMYAAYGNAVRIFAFAARSGRLSAGQLDATFLSKCQAQVAAAGDSTLLWSQQNAYGSSFPQDTKGVQSAGWYFSSQQAFDITVAYQLNPKATYLDAIIRNMNYEGGDNPVNVTYVTGLGWKRQREIVNQEAQNDRQILPPDGIPLGNIQVGPLYTYTYGTTLASLSFPSDTATTAPYPFYDRWGDIYNVSTEFISIDQARSLSSLAYVASLTSMKTQAWKSAQGQLNIPSGTAALNTPTTISMTVPGMDLNGARITWEARDQEPAYGPTYTISPKNAGVQWVEAEAQWPDGRRVVATGTFSANSPVVNWVDDAIPAGGVASVVGGDTWNWISNPTPVSGKLALQSSIASAEHQIYFDWATATLQVDTGDTLFAYVYLDPANPPSEVMLQWNNGTWEHRAYWGANSVLYGTTGTTSRQYMGALPPTGQWVKLQVPASKVGLEGTVAKGMSFTLYGGRATWDVAGKTTLVSSNTPPPGTTNVTTTLPSIKTQATVSTASLVGSTNGVITVSRATSTNTALTVNYTVGGTAVNGVDIIQLATNVTIPAGAISANINIVPKAQTNLVNSKTVVLTLATNAAYAVATPNVASVTLAGNSMPGAALKAVANGMTLNWPSVVGKSYRIAYKTNLTDTAWTDLTGTITATNSAMPFVDATSPKPRQRFYIIYGVN